VTTIYVWYVSQYNSGGYADLRTFPSLGFSMDVLPRTHAKKISPDKKPSCQSKLYCLIAISFPVSLICRMARIFISWQKCELLVTLSPVHVSSISIHLEVFQISAASRRLLEVITVSFDSHRPSSMVAGNYARLIRINAAPWSSFRLGFWFIPTGLNLMFHRWPLLILPASSSRQWLLDVQKPQCQYRSSMIQ